MNFRKFLKTIFLFIFLGVVILGFLYSRNILDFIAYKTTPNGSVAEIYSNELKLTSAGELIFYGTYPKLDSKTEFNADCKPGKNILEFGCYYAGINRIYLLDIKEPNLKTMVDVGAAHEMLHAVYARLTANQKAEINSLIEADYSKIHNADLASRLKSYAVTEPGNQDNELHSILGTEFGNLSNKLEEHYRQYFFDRAQIVVWNTKNQTFIKGKEDLINKQKLKIEADLKKLKLLDAYMLSLKKSGNIVAYNSLVPEQNNLVFSLKIQVNKYNADVATYNDIIASLNSHTYSSYDSSQIK